MAIQVRRGNYADLDKSRLVAGEPLTSLDQLPDGDYYVGMTIAPGTVVRLATWTNLNTVLQECEQYAESAEESAESASSSATTSETYGNLSESYAVGGTGTRTGEDTDNAMYYYAQSDAIWRNMRNAMQVVTPTVEVDFETGMLSYTGSFFDFVLDRNTGHLTWGVAI